MIDAKRIAEILPLSITKKKDIIKADAQLKELFAKRMGINLTNAKKVEIDNFFNSLKKELETKIVETPKAEKVKKIEKKEELEVIEELEVESEPVNLPEEEILETKEEVPERIIRKVISDLYPNINHKRRLIQNDRLLLMSFRLAKKELQRANMEEMDDFLYNHCKDREKFWQQITVGWIGNKKKVFAKLETFNRDLTADDLTSLVKDHELSIEDIEIYCYINLEKFSDATFNAINGYYTQKDVKETPKPSASAIEETKTEKKDVSADRKIIETKETSKAVIDKEKKEETKEIDKKDVIEQELTEETEIKGSPQKEYIEKFDKLRRIYEQEKNELRKEISELKRKNEQEKVQLKQEVIKEYKNKIEKVKEENTEEKNQLLRQGQARENRLREDKDNIEKQLKESKHLIEELKKDLTQKNTELGKIISKATNLEKRNEDMQKKFGLQIEEVSKRIEELEDDVETYKLEQIIYLEGKMAVDELLQRLIQRVSDLENLKVSSMLKSNELNSVITELNAPDPEKEKIYRLLNNAEFPTTVKIDDNIDLWHIWDKLITEEKNIIGNYLETIIKNLNQSNFLDNLQNMADLKYNLKAREILLQILYEKGHKAYKFS